MKLSISEARKRLPELVRQVRKDAGAKVEIMVRDEVVAELRAALPEPEPGVAAKKLVELMRRLPRHRGRKTDISTHVKEHLYGSGAKSRQWRSQPGHGMGMGRGHGTLLTSWTKLYFRYAMQRG